MSPEAFEWKQQNSKGGAIWFGNFGPVHVATIKHEEGFSFQLIDEISGSIKNFYGPISEAKKSLYIRVTNSIIDVLKQRIDDGK